METSTIAAGIEEHFGGLEDPRRHNHGRKLHKLLDIVVIAICGVICGANTWEDVAAFGRAKEAWFAQFLELPHGIPSHDTFNRVFNRLDTEQFQNCFISWTTAVSQLIGGQVIAIDGKVPRGSHDRGVGKAAIDMVSAWATQNRLVLGQVKVDEKSNEITAIPALLRALAISGCIVTIDAMGCQTEIAAQIIEQGADYILALKGNQGQLFEDVVALFADLEASNYTAYTHDYCKTVDKGHGRIEIRECWTISEPEILKHLRGSERWKKLATVSCIRSRRKIGDKETSEVRYHIASITGAKPLLSGARAHWGIENRLHWRIDIAFDEDRSRVRTGNGAANFVILRHIALNLLQHEKTCKRSIQGKRLRAGWEEKYLLKVLSGLSSLNS